MFVFDYYHIPLSLTHKNKINRQKIILILTVLIRCKHPRKGNPIPSQKKKNEKRCHHGKMDIVINASKYIQNPNQR